MFSKDVLIGLFIGIANCRVAIETSHRSTLGYRITPEIEIKPILTITRIKDLVIISDMIPLEFFDARTQWFSFRTVINIMYEKRHLTLKGFDEILKIKGLI